MFIDRAPATTSVCTMPEGPVSGETPKVAEPVQQPSAESRVESMSNHSLPRSIHCYCNGDDGGHLLFGIYCRNTLPDATNLPVPELYENFD